MCVNMLSIIRHATEDFQLSETFYKDFIIYLSI